MAYKLFGNYGKILASSYRVIKLVLNCMMVINDFIIYVFLW